TLTTEMMVGIYRTHEALEAAWKYFILGSVGIALALFSAPSSSTWRPVRSSGRDSMRWFGPRWLLAQAHSIRRCSNLSAVRLRNQDRSCAAACVAARCACGRPHADIATVSAPSPQLRPLFP